MNKDNSIPFFPANHLVTAWAMSKIGKEEAALKWLDDQVKKHPENKIIAWSRASFKKQKTAQPDMSDASTRLIVRLQNMHIMKDKKGSAAR